MLRTALIALFFGVFLASPPAQAALSEQQAAQVKKIEEALNGIKTMQARFTQTAPNGKEVSGTFYLSRPGKLRFEYDPPVTDFIVADGVFLYFYDGQMKQQSNMPISGSLADFFLRKHLDLSGDVTVKKLQKKGGFWEVSVAQTNDPAAGTLVIGLDQKTLALQKWRVIDAQGVTTKIQLKDINTGMSLDRNLFYYHDPERKMINYNN